MMSLSPWRASFFARYFAGHSLVLREEEANLKRLAKQLGETLAMETGSINLKKRLIAIRATSAPGVMGSSPICLFAHPLSGSDGAMVS
jgi:hypothetical protein